MRELQPMRRLRPILPLVALVTLLIGAVVLWVRDVQKCEARGGIYVSRFSPCEMQRR